MENELNEDWLAKALLAERDALPDDEFSAQVLAALPPPVDRQWVHNSIIFSAIVVAMAIALFILPAGHWLTSLFNSLPIFSITSRTVVFVATGVIVVATACVEWMDRETPAESWAG